MKKILILIALVSPTLCIAQKKGQGPKVFDLLIGTYTGDTPTSSHGIYAYRFYEETGKTIYMSEVETDNPSFLAVSSDSKFIYAVNESEAGKSAVTSFSFDKVTGKIEKINSQPATGPAHISVDKARKNVFVSNYGGGSLQVFPINADGSLGACSQTIQNTGTGPDKSRQTEPHVHSAILSPDEKFVLSADLGTDKINVFRYKDSKTPPLTPANIPSFSTAGGSGPRHNDFSPNGKFMYNVQEMSASVTAFAYHNGELKEVQTIKMMPDDFKGTNGAADIHVSPDGLFLYATNRGSVNQIFAFAINQEDGKLSPVAHYNTGKAPRNFVIDPTGRFILVGSADHVDMFKVDKATGKLTLYNNTLKVSSAVCLKMVVVE